VSIPSLPQHDPERASRRARVDSAAASVVYNYERFAGVALATAVPKSDQPHASWFTTIAEVLVKIGVNAEKVQKRLSRLHPEHPEHSEILEIIRSAERGGMHALFDELTILSEGGKELGRATSFADFEALFVSFPLPDRAATFRDDLSFARMRVAGPNPMMLRRVDRIPDHFGVTPSDVDRALGVFQQRGINISGGGLVAALAEGRAFLADYSALTGATGGTWNGFVKHIYDPLALFMTVGADRTLLPVAIQCSQAPGPNVPVLTPADGARWAMAKTAVHVADGCLHQAVSHLARTHLVIEAVLLAARRNLSENHPLSRLLEPHFEGTLYINDAADTKLMGPGGGVDTVLACPIALSRKVVEGAVRSWSFTGSMLETDLRTRGLDDRDAIPDHPYREDAILVHAAIRDWVESFVRTYYKDGASVREDVELQSMFAELGSNTGGRLRDVPSLAGVNDVVKALTHVIFTASAQHAVVNFAQLQEMSYAPAYPLAGYAAAPTDAPATEADWFGMLPPLGLAHYQSTLGVMLGSVRHTVLGQYPHEAFRPFAGDERLAPFVGSFRKRLEDVEAMIRQRNESREPYVFLMPSLIPQSINI
jgi:arachidonate 15-lipoxygenase